MTQTAFKRKLLYGRIIVTLRTIVFFTTNNKNGNFLTC